MAQMMFRYGPNPGKLLREIQGKSQQQIAEIIAQALQPPIGKRFIRTKSVLGKVPWSRTTLWRKIRDGHFPAPIRLSECVNVWLEETVDAWIDARLAEVAE